MPRRGLPSWNRVFLTSEILARLNWLSEEAARWRPALPVALMFAVALFEAVVLPRRLWAKGAWVLIVALCGLGAVALLRSEQQAERAQTADRLAAETTALRGLWSQWDTLSKTLPPPSGDSPAAAFDTVDDALASLSVKVVSVNEQIAALKAGGISRSIDADVATKLAEYLRQYGSYRVVVSCVPSDVEAYSYANQLVDILKAAGWDANGPETTANALEGPEMGVSIFIRDPSAPDAAKILLDAFSKFDIPHRSGISPSDAIPDAATVELFIAKKP
jgi:hypothetical protein